MQLIRFIGFRMASFTVTVVGVITLVFVLTNFIGDPAVTMLPPTVTDEQLHLFREGMGLNDPLIVRYGRFLWGILQGDLGDSLWQRAPVVEIVVARLPATMLLIGSSLTLIIVVGLTLGMLSALTRMEVLSYGVGVMAFVCLSVIEFWIGITLIRWFASNLQIFQTGYGLDWVHLTLPVLTISIQPIGRLILLTRTSMTEEKSKPYVLTARAGGLKGWRVALHILRNALCTVITWTGYEFVKLFSSAVIVENVFGWPGLGQLGTSAVMQRDLFLLQGVVVFMAVLVVLLNIAMDLVYGWIDPRIRV